MKTVGISPDEGTDVEADASDEESDATRQLAKDDLFHILQNQRRRRVLRYMQEQEGSVRMRKLAEQVAAWEHETTVEELASDERQRVYISLYQCHLPKLDEKGVLNYNQSRGFVEQGELAGEFEPYLNVQTDGLKESEQPVRSNSTHYYSGATVLGLALTGASWIGLTPSAMTNYLAAFITGMFTFVTLGVLYWENRGVKHA